MAIIVALIISIILQFYAAFVALSLIKKSKYNISWMLMSAALLIMAVRRVFELVPFLQNNIDSPVITFSNWLGIFISVIIAIGMIYIKKIFIFLKRIDEIRSKSEKKVLSAIIKTEEKERKRFSKDLHDGLGPLLSSVKMAISSLEKTTIDEQKKEVISNTQTLVNESIKSIKEISNNLSPHTLDNFGLQSAIKNFTDKLNSNIKIITNTNIKEKRYPYNTEVVLYRIICELISNTIKHAYANTINIDLFEEKSSLLLYYYDDGKGFDTEKVLNNENTGMGYPNIISRLKSINGRINIESSTNKGMQINISVPV